MIYKFSFSANTIVVYLNFRGGISLLDDYPELVFNIILNVFFGCMAMTTVRMKFLWMPHVCVVAAGVISHQVTLSKCLESINLKGFLVRTKFYCLNFQILSMFKKHQFQSSVFLC